MALATGVSDDEIRRFEQRAGVKLPADLSTYFKKMDGMQGEETDHQDIRFWSLNEMKPVFEEIPSADVTLHYVVFADYSLWAHAYAIYIGGTPEGRVAIVGGDSPLVVADSFAEFIDMYLRDPLSIFKSKLNQDAR
jgi:SMI1 / KNR4 family (SUKH-1)